MGNLVSKKKAIIVYHRVDFDGIFSAVISNKALSLAGYKVSAFGYNYSDEIPDLKMLTDHDLVCLVDISFPAEKMIELKDSGKLIWIDHHLTAISDSQTFGYSDVPGIRKIGIAACELTWAHFFPDHFQSDSLVIPKIIQYLSAYDTWDKTRFDWEEVLNVQYSLKSRYGISYNSILKNIDSLICDENILESLISEGAGISSYLNKSWRSACKSFSFKILVDKKYNGICMLSTEFSSNVFNSIISEYDMVCVCNRRDYNTYSISIYGEEEKFDSIGFSAGDYLKKNYRGGGHKCAAGGILDLNQFIKLVFECEL